MLYLISGSTVFADGPDIIVDLQMMSIAPVSTETHEAVRLSCVGTLVNTATIVTASHCLPTSLSTIAILCLGEKDANIDLLPVTALRHHADQDVAVVHFQTSRRCHYQEEAVELAAHNKQRLAIYSQHTLQLHELELLQTQPYNYIVSDASCQTQGDSGSPVFSLSPDGKAHFTAMLISGTADCPSLQILAELHNIRDWLLLQPLLPLQER